MSKQFDPQALYDAIDAQRRERGMTWTDLSKELMVSTSTIKGLTQRKYGIELDGVIGMCRWVGRSFESFAGGENTSIALPARSATGYFIRFDKKALHAAVNAERERRGLTWDQVAKEIFPSWHGGAKLLKDMAKGGRGEVFSMLAVSRWIGRPVESFMHESIS